MKKCTLIDICSFIAVITFLFCATAFAQNSSTSYAFSSITTEEGLSNNVVFDIHQDVDGYIWMATNNGLNRFDGYTVKSFFHSKKDSTSISSNTVRCIIEDEQGRLWFGTKAGINLYHKDTQSFESPSLKGDFSLADKEIMSLHKDDLGRLWMKASDDIVVFNTETLNATSVYNTKAILSITLDTQKIWLSNSTGTIITYDINSKSITKEAQGLLHSSIHYSDASNTLWLPSDFHPKAPIENFKYLPKLPDNLNPKHLLEINGQKTWIGTNNGLFEYNSENKTISKIFLGKSTLINQIRSLYKDNSGGIWVGTLGGVFHYDAYRKVFEHSDIVEDLDDVVMGLHAAKDGIYANALGKGLFFKAHHSSDFNEIKLPHSFPRQGLFIWDIASVSDSTFPLWLATNDGLICLNPETSYFKHIDIPTAENNEKVSFSLLDTHMDYMWVASHRALHKISKTEVKLLGSYTLGVDVNYPGIQKLVAIGASIYIATENAGLFSFDLKTEQFSKVALNENTTVNAAIWDLYASENTLWIATNDGLYKLNTKNGNAEAVLEDNQVVYSITKDDAGILWMGTDKGIKSYDPNLNSTKYYSTIDGLKNSEFNRKSVIIDSLDNLWFGGVNGISHFSPNHIKRVNPNWPYVHITSLNIVTSDSSFTVSDLSKNLVFPWEHNTLEIEYVALNYTNTVQNSYKYKMEGHDPRWVELQSPIKARYVKLPVGTYKFKVEAANSDGVWNTVGDSLQIEIKPPIWRSKTAYIVYIVLGYVLFLIFKRLKTYRIRIREVEQEKAIIAKKVEQEFIVLNNKTKVYLDELKYIKAAGNYLEFYTVNKTIIDRNKLKEITEKLPPNFIRTHRSYVINKNFIVWSNSTTATIKPNIETPLSRTFDGNLT